MREYLIYISIAIVVISGISHSILGALIVKFRDVATNNPSRLRGVTPQETLEKVAHWENLRTRIWPLAVVIAGGFLLLWMFAK